MSIQERVARAMFAWGHDESWERGEELTKNIYLNDARAAITTFLEAAAEQGWRMVPEETTEEMNKIGAPIVSGIDRNFSSGRDEAEEVYNAMIAAAPPFEWDK